MSLGSSDMAGGALGTAFSLLLLASIIQGRPDLQVLRERTVEAVVGENVVLPCVVKSTHSIISSIEWRKNSDSKLIVYNPSYGTYPFWPNVTIHVDNKTMSSYLHMNGVDTWDSGIYTCEISTFPLGSIMSNVELRIEDLKIECNAGDAVEVPADGNVTIPCRKQPSALYRWTKNGELVSENESLELLWVTDAHTGVYTLTVTAGNTSLRKEFIISVLRATTGWRTDLTTESPQSNVTEEGLVRPADTTSLTTAFDGDVTWGVSTDATSDSSKPRVTVSAEASTSNDTHVNATSSADPHYFNSPRDPETEPTRTYEASTFTDQWAPGNLSTTSSYGSSELSPTQETRNESAVEPDISSSTSPGESSAPRSTTENSEISAETHTTRRIRGEAEEESNSTQSVLLTLIILPMLVLIAVAGFLCRKRVIKHRMDLPPPFKPPPPPVKYTSAVRSQDHPISRCNSLTETDDIESS